MNQVTHVHQHPISIIGCLLICIVPLVGCQENTTDNSASQNRANNVADEQRTPNESSQTLNASSDLASRKFTFRYAFTLKDLPRTGKVKIWVPIAESNSHQTVSYELGEELADLKINRDQVHKNKIGFLETTGNTEYSFSLEYEVERQVAKLDTSEKTLSEAKSETYLSANKLVPIDGRPAELLANKSVPDEPTDAAKMLYELVETHMTYDKSKPGYGKGDAIWACDSQTGNCTDFHSLFIALARNQKIPARFEIGFPLPPGDSKPESNQIGGYHCWAWFHIDGQGWTPVDISEADKHPELKNFYFGALTQDRIGFSKGRDIVLVPAAKSEPLNYFVYPHVEVDGEILPKKNIELNFSFTDRP
ncbi:MAG: transglutaminase-like domain-containing protein [Planctomycetota bacterium]